MVFELVKQKVYRDNFWLRIKGGNLYRKLGEDGLKLELDSQVAGWDEHTVYRQRIRNTAANRSRSRSVATIRATWYFVVGSIPPCTTSRPVQFRNQGSGWRKAELDYEIILRQGCNQKQNRVELQTGEPGR